MKEMMTIEVEKKRQEDAEEEVKEAEREEKMRSLGHWVKNPQGLWDFEKVCHSPTL